MPVNLVKSVSNKCGKSKSEVEQIWEDAKKKAENQEHKEDWDYIVGIFKSMVGKECAKKMGWSLKENCLDKLVKEYLNEKREPWEDSDLAVAPNMSIKQVKATKQPNGKYKLFFIGTRNEVFPGEIFNSASEARNFFKVQQIKAQKENK